MNCWHPLEETCQTTIKNHNKDLSEFPGTTNSTRLQLALHLASQSNSCKSERGAEITPDRHNRWTLFSEDSTQRNKIIDVLTPHANSVQLVSTAASNNLKAAATNQSVPIDVAPMWPHQTARGDKLTLTARRDNSWLTAFVFEIDYIIQDNVIKFLPPPLEHISTSWHGNDSREVGMSGEKTRRSPMSSWRLLLGEQC